MWIAVAAVLSVCIFRIFNTAYVGSIKTPGPCEQKQKKTRKLGPARP